MKIPYTYWCHLCKNVSSENLELKSHLFLVLTKIIFLLQFNIFLVVFLSEKEFLFLFVELIHQQCVATETLFTSRNINKVK